MSKTKTAWGWKEGERYRNVEEGTIYVLYKISESKSSASGYRYLFEEEGTHDDKKTSVYFRTTDPSLEFVRVSL